MTITEQHVSEEFLNSAIEHQSASKHPYDVKVMDALLELKQRRAEDRNSVSNPEGK